MGNPRTIANALRSALGLGATGDRQHLSTLARSFVTPNGNQSLYVGTAGELRYNASMSAGIGQCIKDNYLGLDTTDQLLITDPFSTAPFTPNAATGGINLIDMPTGTKIGYFVLGAGQTLVPAIVANGLDIGGDQAADEGFELFSHMLGAQGRPFIVGRDPGFYMRVKLLIADASGTDELLVGFRRPGVSQTAFGSYADYAALGINSSANPAAIYTLTGNDGTDVATDTTQTLADARAITFEVSVSSAGLVTYRHDAATAGSLAQPTAVAAFTFDDGDPLVPFIRMINHTDIAGEVAVQSYEVGYLGN